MVDINRYNTYNSYKRKALSDLQCFLRVERCPYTKRWESLICRLSPYQCYSIDYGLHSISFFILLFLLIFLFTFSFDLVPSRNVTYFPQDICVIKFSISVYLVVCFWTTPCHLSPCSPLNKCEFDRFLLMVHS